MQFNSFLFLGFCAVVLSAYWCLSRSRIAQNMLLLVASYGFYAAWDYRFLSLIAISTLVDYYSARRIEAHRKTGNAVTKNGARRWLILSLTTNLGLLAVFKYLDFGIESLVALSTFVGLPLNLQITNILLPVGISFYTFQTLSYTIDVYRGKLKPENDLLSFAVYVAFFPQLVAGPIERATHFLPQVQRQRSFRLMHLKLGLQFVATGYFCKVVLADRIGPLVDQVFERPDAYGGAVVWLGALGFAVQIYSDFMGYSLIARGVSQMLGLRLVSNFRQPYLATSPRDFWHRWHRSLSAWLREYLYFSLGGSRDGRWRTCRNLMMTMVLGGLWHGAAWHFVWWGIFHGALLVACHTWQRSALHKGMHQSFAGNAVLSRVWNASCVCVMFLVTLVGWVLFRCQTVDEIGTVLARMITMPPAESEIAWAFAIPILSAFAILLSFDLLRERMGSQLALLRIPRVVQVGAFVFLISCVIVSGFQPSSFIYFQF